MNQHTVQWLTSERGKPMLVVDDYIFANNGKGKNPNVMYWICAGNASNGCSARAGTNGQALTELRGAHDHANDDVRIKGLKMKVNTPLLMQ